MKWPEYLVINPLGKVPAVRHGDVVVTEAAAICACLADALPEAGQAPPLAERGAELCRIQVSSHVHPDLERPTVVRWP